MERDKEELDAIKTEKKESSGTDRQLSRLHGNLNILNDALELLETKLNPVILESAPPKPETANEDQAQLCGIASQVYDAANRVGSYEVRVCELIERLDI